MLGTSKEIKYPGLNILPPGVERHVVNGGALTAFQIFPDDELEIINNEGNQICEIICFNKDGKSDVGILNLKSNNAKNFIRNILNGKDETILATNHQLKKRNLNISDSKSSIIFDLDTKAVVKACHRHWLPENISGNFDKETSSLLDQMILD